MLFVYPLLRPEQNLPSGLTEVTSLDWPISPAVATYIIRQLVEEPKNERLLLNVDWYIMPVMNPDGIVI